MPVTLSVDRVIFREPIHVGELVTFQASVNHTGRTSKEVGIRVTTQDPVHRHVRHASSSYFTMVSVDEGDRPTPCASERRFRSQSDQTSNSGSSGPIIPSLDVTSLRGFAT